MKIVDSYCQSCFFDFKKQVSRLILVEDFLYEVKMQFLLFASFYAGYRNNNNGDLNNVGSNANVWSSSVSGTNASNLNFNSDNANSNSNNRANGQSVRCLKD